MKISLRDIFKKVGVGIMIFFIGLLIPNKVMYTHIHKLDDGSIVVHAHPYDKSENENPEEQHHHAKAELFFLQSLELFFLVTIVSVILFAGLRSSNFNIPAVNQYSEQYIISSLGRAPPCN